MKKLFKPAGLALCGALVTMIAVPVQAKEKINQAHYYFFSPTKFARLIQSQGVVRSFFANGAVMNFTDKNHTGKKPSWNSKMVWAGFGLPPQEFDIVVDRIKFDEQKNRLGRKPPNVLAETNFVAGNAARPVGASSDDSFPSIGLGS